MSVRVRYAPSPTGHLHIGGVRTALFNYLFAKHHHGKFVLRLEDTDLERNVPGAEEEMLDGFRWLGFQWDEGPDIGGAYGPYRCTERLDVYRNYLEKLKADNLAYPCFCTSEQLESDRKKAMAEERSPQYNGRCRNLSEQERKERIASGVPYSWRFAVPAGKTVQLDDLVRGHVDFLSDEVGDFVIVKSNGLPTYNFQVVVDDALMDITHVIRGEEHLSNTPRQLLVYAALGFPLPKFAHLPQVLNENRKKLSKRDPNVLPVQAYRELGYLPEALVNFLALLGWSPGGEEELFTLEDIAKQFDLDRINRSGAVFDVQKLHWMAAQYMKRRDLGAVTELVKEDLNSRGIEAPSGCDDKWLTTVVGLYQDKMACIHDFARLAGGFFTETIHWSKEAVEIIREDSAQRVISRYLELIEAEDAQWTSDAGKARFKQIQKELGVKGKGLFMPVRAAVTGEIHGPDLQQTIASLPKAWVIARVKEALSLVSAHQG